MKIDISVLNFLILIFRNYFTWKWKFWIPNYYFGLLKLIIQFRKLLIESKNGHFNFEYCYLNLKIDISILNFFYLNSKKIFEIKIDISILNYYFGI
jgi:hypothetical protein